MTSAQPLPEETLTITEVAVRAGLSTDALRYYERAGLIDRVGRSTGGQRRYATADLDWIAFLPKLRDTVMPIADMQRFAELRRGDDATMTDRLALLREHRTQLAERIRRLRAGGRALDEKITHYEKSLGEQ